MNWKNPLDDPIPAILYESHSAAVRQKEHPCSLCRIGSDEIHFHGSDMGKCPRRVVYSKRFGKDSGGTTPEFFADGHFHENLMLVNIHNGLQINEDIKELFHKVSVLPSVNREELISVLRYKLKGQDVQEVKMVAHYDGLLICQNDDEFSTTFLLECKSVKDEKYYKIKAGEMDTEWYGQIQNYLNQLNKTNGIDRAYLIVKNRTTGLILQPIRVDLDSSYLKEKREAFIKIHQALLNNTLVPRAYENRKNAECKWCAFGSENGNGECWKKEKESIYELQTTVETRTSPRLKKKG